MKRFAVAFALVFVGLLPALAQAPPATGLPPFGSFQSAGFDTVNLQNLNDNFSIPIVSVPGRGTNFNFSIVFDSLLWQKIGTNWQPAVNASGNATWGWKKDTPGGEVSFHKLTLKVKCGDGTWNYNTTWSSYGYRDVVGTLHGFTLAIYDIGCTGNQTTTGSPNSTDGSGLYVSTNDPDSPVVIGPGGVQSPTNGSATDTNGNLISKTVVNSSENDWTDTVGHIVMKVITGTNSIQYQFQDTTGVYRTATLNLSSSPYTVKTFFNCSGVGEYTSSTGVYLPVSLVMPNNKQYTFTYEQTPGSGPGFTTGRVQRVTLPTGGYYEFDYPGSNDSVNCADGSTSSLTRIVNDGSTSSTWQFVRTLARQETTITAPLLPYDSVANQTNVFFDANGHEISRLIYQGSNLGSAVRTINTTWAANGTPATRVTILEDNATQSEIDTGYDNNGNLTSKSEYDWGNAARGPLLRSTSLSYLNTTAYKSANIVNRGTSMVVTDGGGTRRFRQDTAYDESAYINSPCTAGAAQHDDTGHGCTFTVRGNPTTVTTYKDPITPANGVAKHLYYDSLGNVVKADADCCQQVAWNYSSATQFAYPDSIVKGPTGTQLSTSATYNAYTGQTATSTDENNQITHFAYDSMKRLTTVTRPDNVQLTTAYDDAALTATATTPITSSSSVKQIGYVDGLGRSIKSVTEDASGTSYSINEQKYDPLGRTYKTSNPHNSTAQYWTETDFDTLGRQTQIILPDNSKTTFSYAGTSETTTDPANNQRKAQSDGLGRVAAVYEPDLANNNLLTQQTSYGYTVLDALATVTAVTTGGQTRTYVFDNLGRLTSVATPETGGPNNLYQYQYNDFNLVTQRTDPRGVVTTYGYDSLNRLHQVSYNVGTTGVPATATVTYTYGTSPAQSNNGRLITMSDGVGPENYSYDTLGRTTQLQKVITGTTYTTTYGYNLASELTSLTYPSTRVMQQTYDAIGRVCAIAGQTSSCSSVTTPYATSFGYNTAFETTGFKYGNGVFAAFGFSADRLQVNCLDYSTTNRNGNCAHDATTKFGLTYSHGAAGQNNGQIASITDAVDSGRTAAYSYDPLLRLSSAATTGSTSYPTWGLQWTYDRYGNRTVQKVTAGTAPGPLTPTDPATNHITTGYTYDANGNLTLEPMTPSNNNYTYDGENRLVTFSSGGASTTYTYDGYGRRVKKVASGTTTTYVFWGAKVIAEYANGSLSKEYVYSGSKLLATISGGTATYHQGDGLSVRMSTNSSGNKVGEQGHFPFGETWYLTNTTTKWQFTSYERDLESGNDYAMARYQMNRVGRFSSPDPIAGAIAVPQSWNRYAYALNNPLSYTDSTGLDYCADGGGNMISEANGGGNDWSCENVAFGTWVTEQDPTYVANVNSDVTQAPTVQDDSLFLELWTLGIGPSSINYGPNDGMTQQLANSLTFGQMRQKYVNKGCPNTSPDAGGAIGTDHVLPFLEGYGNGNAALMQVGGFVAYGQTNGTVTTFTAVNFAGQASFSAETTIGPTAATALPYAVGLIVNPYLGMAVSVLSANGVSDNPYGVTGPYHNITQTFTWTESNLCKQGG
jgi:RHS repeat-associated protein